MTSYSVIIVDDEIPQQQLLSNMMQEFKNYSLISVCSSVDQAVEQIPLLKPDLVFLDVVMPPKTGFDVISELEDQRFNFIFTTSFQEYAIRAFKVSAVDYLLKPFDSNDLGKALQKFEKKNELQNAFLNIQTLIHNINSNSLANNKIALPGINGFHFVKISDIVRCQGDDMYTTFFLSDGSNIMVSKNMKESEMLLEDYDFFRIHTSHLINMNCIKQYIKGEGGQIKMTDGSVLDVSRRKKDEFLSLFNKL